MIKRGRPGATEYQLLKAGHTITTKIDLSVAYAMNEAGEYSLQMQTQVYYHPEAENEASRSRDVEQTLVSTTVTFQLVEGGIPRKTLGALHRRVAIKFNTQQAGYQHQSEAGYPLDPKFISGTAAQRALTKEIHRASYHYVSAAGDDIDDNRRHYVSWFGAVDTGHIHHVKQNYQGMKNALERDVITYVFNDPRCRPFTYAFTFKGSRRIWLCNKYIISENILGIDTKLCTIVHQLSNAVMYTNDYTYGRQTCLNLAKNSPNKAVNNGDNYCYHSETTNIFDYGFDSLTRWTNFSRYTYVTRGNIYLRYSDRSASTIDSGYPALIKGNWGNLPDSFVAGFDSMSDLLNGKTCVTKGGYYVSYSGDSLDPWVLPLQGFWGQLPANFAAGFDSMVAMFIPNGKTHVSKGIEYIRYSDRSPTIVDPGFPKPLQDEKNWWTLPASFANGFDTMAFLGNRKFYVTKNKLYIRYSGYDIDYSYPRPIKGNWGTIKFPGPQ